MVSMLDCIKRVPDILNSILENRESTFRPLFERFSERLEQMDEVVLIGSGTSYTSAFTGKYLAEKASGLRVTVLPPNEFLHYISVRNKNALYVFISQTGNSRLTNRALEFARDAGYMTAVISESAKTMAAKKADVFLDMHCGKEEYPMRTIGYSATVLTVMMLGIALGEWKGTMSSAEISACLENAEAAADNIPSVIQKTMEWLDHNRRSLLRADCLIFTGGGPLYGVALEGAVKVWETPQMVSIGYEMEEGMHGPNYGYSQRHCVVVLNDGGADNDRAVSLCRFMKYEKNNGFLIGVNPVERNDLEFVPKGGDFCCLEFAAAVQIISCRLATDQGRDLYAPHDNRVMMKYFRSHEED